MPEESMDRKSELKGPTLFAEYVDALVMRALEIAPGSTDAAEDERR
jgi:hypothetical protein